MTRQLASRLVKREEKLVRPVFKPSLLCREVMKDDPGASGMSLAKRAKGYLSSEDSVARREHVESLPSQGELMRATSYTPDIWASSVVMLGSEGLKFTLNAATDTLPHNCNLARWRGGSVSE